MDTNFWFERARSCKSIAEIESAIDELSAAFERPFDPSFGFAHIVLDDLNLSDDHINGCLAKADILDYLNNRFQEIDESADQFSSTYDIMLLLQSTVATIAFLKGLLYVDESIRVKTQT